MRRRILIVVLSISLLLCIVFAVLIVNRIHTDRLIRCIEDGDMEGFEDTLPKVFFLNLPPVTPIEAFLSDEVYNTPLQKACRVGDLQMVAALIDAGADVNYDYGDFSPLLCACASNSNDNLSIVQLLIANGADASYTQAYHNALYQIACQKDIPNGSELMDLLVANGAETDWAVSGQSMLHYACYWGNDELIVHMVNEYGFDINEPNDSGQTPLMNYCRGSGASERTVRWLLSCGAEADAVDSCGMTAYDYAIMDSKQALAALLSDAGDPSAAEDKTPSEG